MGRPRRGMALGMRHWILAGALAVVLAGPAVAQLVPSGEGSGPAAAPAARAPAPDVAPPALPGFGDQPGLATAPSVQKPATGDPTTALFTAVTNGDYNAAQDAVSRGADLNAQNPLGETPLELSVALNRNSITFMLLSARNEAGDDDAPVSDPMPVTAAPLPYHHHHHDQAVPVASVTAPAAVPLASQNAARGNNPGVPNPSAGFLGFGQSQ